MDDYFTGQVKFYDESKGYGFITHPGHPDAFIHAKVMKAGGILQLLPGQHVSFTLSQRNGRDFVSSIKAA